MIWQCELGCVPRLRDLPLTCYDALPSLFPSTPTPTLFQVWDASTGAKLHSLEGPSGEIEWLQWHSRGNALLAGASDGTVWLWDVSASKADCLTVLAGHDGAVPAGGFSPSGKSILTGGADGIVKVWNPKTGEASSTFTGHGWCEAPVTHVCMHPSAPLLAASSQDGSVRIANVSTGKVVAAFFHGGAGAGPVGAGAGGEEGEGEEEGETTSVER